MRLELLGQEVRARDGRLLLRGVARDLQDLHPVPQRRRNRLQRVRGGDEEHPRQIERHLEVVIRECLVLLRIQHLEQGRRGIALVAGAELVDLVQHQHGVGRAHPLERLHDPTGQGANVGAPVTADLRLVPHAAERHAGELPPHGAGDALSQGRLADARGAHQAEDRSLQVAAQLAHGEKLQDPLLHLLEAVVIRIEHVARVLDLQVVLGEDSPGQIRDPLQPRPRHRLLRRLLGQLLQPRQLLVDLSAHVFRQLQRGDLLAQLVAVGAGAFAQLVLDGLQLLAQDVLALRLGDLLLHGAFDVVRGLQHLAPAGEQGDHQSQPLDRVDRIQHLLLVGGVGGHVVGEQIRESSRIFDGVERLSYLRRDRRQQGEDVAGNPARLECERLHFSALGRRNRNFLDPHRRKRLAFEELQHAHAAHGRDDHSAVPAHGLDAGEGGHRVDAQLALGAERDDDALVFRSRGGPRQRGAARVRIEPGHRSGQQHGIFEDEYR